jgi:cytoskeletal protein CcmA (bactofilin family)
MSKKGSISLSLAAVAASLIVLSAPALAQTPEPPPPTPTPTPAVAPPLEDDRRILRGDRNISGGNFTLESDETLRGDLNVFGGNITLDERSRVEGNVNIFGGNADIAGTVTGDLQIVGGNVDLRSSGNIEGDVIKVGGQLNRDSGAVIGGRETTMNLPFIPELDGRPEVRVERGFDGDRDGGPFDWFWNILGGIFGLFLAAVIVLIAMGVAAIAPTNMAMASGVATASWLVSGAVGALTLIAVPIVAGLLIITLCLSPFGVLLLVLYAAGILAGWSVSARLLGERIMRAVNRSDWSLVGQTLAGAVLLALLGGVPIIGGLIGFTATALGLGALVLTRAGTRTYPLEPVRAMSTMPFAATDPIVPPLEPEFTPTPEPSDPPTTSQSDGEPKPSADDPKQS